MHYKYREVSTVGPFGTSLTSRCDDALMLGKIGEFSYLYSLLPVDLTAQFPEIEMQEVTLTADELAALKSNATLQLYKNSARDKIRKIKSLEDDLTDLKQIVQFISRGLSSIWVTLPATAKSANPYKTIFDDFTLALTGMELRVDLEADASTTITKILSDEVLFAAIAKEEYLDKFHDASESNI